MKVVVTGASGFIGRNVLLRAPKDWEIVAVYHRTLDLDAFVRAHSLSNVRAVQCDLRDETQVQSLARSVGGRADAMLYLAANGDPAASAERPRWDLESSAVAIISTLEHSPADHVVYVSSGAVYDGLRGPVTPATPVAPLLPYAISKLASESYVRFFSERRETFGSYVNVRFFGAYGPYEAPRKITTKWLQAIAKGQREFVVRGNGENLIDFMYIDDAVDGFIAMVKAKGQRATVDFASGMPVKVNDVVATMARICGVDITVRHEGEVAEYIEFRSVDPAVRDQFGLVPAIPFEDGLQRLRSFLAGADQLETRQG